MEQYGMLSSGDLSADRYDYRGVVSVIPVLEGTPSVRFETWVTSAQRGYLTDLAKLLDIGLRGEALEAELKQRYPGHRGVEFQLHMTATNPAFGG